MNKLPSDDQELQFFLRQHRPVPPPASPDLEEKLISAIANSPQNQVKLALSKPQKRQQLWIIPSTIAAGLLIAWSSSRILIPAPELANTNLESFLETNWNDVTGDPGNNNLQTDWMLQTNPTH